MFSAKGFFQTALGFISGDKDILEGMQFGGVWMAGADGKISKAELDSVRDSTLNDDFISRIYSADVIASQMNATVEKVKTGGIPVAEKQLRDLASREEPVRHAVYLAIYKVAAKDGTVDGDERRVANQIAAILNITNEDRDQIESTVSVGGPVGLIFE